MEKENLFHFIYKTTNLKNGKFYIGTHSTNNIEDGYLGSGKHLRNSVYYHGKENFKREVMEFLPDRKSLKEREKEIVNVDLLKEEKCLNIKEGGDGGGGFYSEEQRKNFHSAGGKAVRILLHKRHNEKMKNDPVYREKTLKNMRGKTPWFKNHKHSDETKRSIGKINSIKQKGEYNSQYGSCWITNGFENKKIKKHTLIPEKFYHGQGRCHQGRQPIL